MVPYPKDRRSERIESRFGACGSGLNVKGLNNAIPVQVLDSPKIPDAFVCYSSHDLNFRNKHQINFIFRGLLFRSYLQIKRFVNPNYNRNLIAIIIYVTNKKTTVLILTRTVCYRSPDCSIN